MINITNPSRKSNMDQELAETTKTVLINHHPYALEIPLMKEFDLFKCLFEKDIEIPESPTFTTPYPARKKVMDYILWMISSAHKKYIPKREIKASFFGFQHLDEIIEAVIFYDYLGAATSSLSILTNKIMVTLPDLIKKLRQVPYHSIIPTFITNGVMIQKGEFDATLLNCNLHSTIKEALIYLQVKTHTDLAKYDVCVGTLFVLGRSVFIGDGLVLSNKPKKCKMASELYSQIGIDVECVATRKGLGVEFRVDDEVLPLVNEGISNEGLIGVNVLYTCIKDIVRRIEVLFEFNPEPLFEDSEPPQEVEDSIEEEVSESFTSSSDDDNKPMRRSPARYKKRPVVTGPMFKPIRSVEKSKPSPKKSSPKPKVKKPTSSQKK